MRGGVAFLNAEEIDVSDCVFEDNTAEAIADTSFGIVTAVGTMYQLGDSARVRMTRFVNNTLTATLRGENDDSAATAHLSLTGGGTSIEDCSIEDNTLSIVHPDDDDFFGLGPNAIAFMRVTPATVSSTRITNNTVTFTGPATNAPELGAALTVFSDATTIQNSLIAANTAPQTAGCILRPLSGNSPAAAILNTTIADNTTASDDPAGLLAEGPVTITNTIVWNNTSAAPPPLDQQLAIAAGALANSSVDSSIVQGWGGSIPGDRTTADDPLFASAPAGDYTLSPGSPAIDSGDNTALPPTLTADLAGNPRRIDDPATPDDGVGSAPIVDRGPFEHIAVPCGPADLAVPLTVLDLADIVAFVEAFTDELPPADLAEPFGVWDTADITAFVAAFQTGCN